MILQEIVNVGEGGGEADTPRRQFDFLSFRDMLYNITIYHLDVLECIQYILVNMVRQKCLTDHDIREILKEIYMFLQYYNNNYRTIYHIERIFIFILEKRLQCVASWNEMDISRKDEKFVIDA